MRWHWINIPHRGSSLLSAARKRDSSAVMSDSLEATVSDAWRDIPVLKVQVRDVSVKEFFDGERITGAQMLEVKEVGVKRLKAKVISIVASDNQYLASAVRGMGQDMYQVFTHTLVFIGSIKAGKSA